MCYSVIGVFLASMHKQWLTPHHIVVGVIPRFFQVIGCSLYIISPHNYGSFMEYTYQLPSALFIQPNAPAEPDAIGVDVVWRDHSPCHGRFLFALTLLWLRGVYMYIL